jgi:ABC-type lipoprotein release transport system permease subunit
MLADWLASPWTVAALVAGGVAALGALALVLATPVYKHVLCAKYLFGGWKAVVPMVSCLPAALGVFLLILVFAIMDGFATETRKMTRGTLSDVIVDAHMAGLPYYDDLIRRIEQIDGVESATPIIQTYAVARIQPRISAVEPLVRPCQIFGIRPAEKVTMGRFRQYLKRQYLKGDEGKEIPAEAQEKVYPAADLLTVPKHYALDGPPRPGCIPGIGLIGAPMATSVPETVWKGVGDRVAAGVAAVVLLIVTLFVWRAARRRPGRTGWVVATALCGLACAAAAVAAALIPVKEEEVLRNQVVDIPLIGFGGRLVVSTIPVRPSGALDTEPGGVPKVQSRALTVVDRFKSGFWESDSTHLYLEFDLAQEMAGMTGRPAEGVPARANQVHVRVTDPSQGPAVCEAIRVAWRDLVDEKNLAAAPHLTVNTWEQQKHMILSVVEIERNIVALMLGAMFIGFGVLIGLISYVMAYIKSRDVGILKALGARDAGVGSLFLGYGFLIGLIGVAAGETGALLMLHYLDAIEIWVNETLRVDVFPREMYYFEHIPRNISAAWCVGVGLGVLALSTLASAAGGLLAAMKQPVEALRYE